MGISTAYLALPYRATITAVGNQLSTSPASNALNEIPQLAWRSSGLSNLFVVLDLGSAQVVEVAALLFSNLRATDTIRVRGAGTEAAVTASPAIDQTFNAFSGSKASDISTKAIMHLTGTLANRTQRFWRFDITATSHPDGFISVGRIMLAQGTDYGNGFQLNATRMFFDDSIIFEGPGYVDVDAYPTLPGWKVAFEFISATHFRDVIAPFFTRIGRKRAVLFVPQPDQPDTWQHEVVYGYVMKDISAEQRVYDGWWHEIEIKSLAP